MAFVVWGLLAGSGVYWLVQLWAKPLATPAYAAPAADSRLAQADLSRLLGATAAVADGPAPAAESRFKLLGVVAPKTGRAAHAGEGVALIAVDGVARTVRIGARVDGELQLLSVNARSASLGRDGLPALSLELATPTPASTGVLAPAALSPTLLGGDLAQGTPPVAMPPMPPVGNGPPSGAPTR